MFAFVIYQERDVAHYVMDRLIDPSLWTHFCYTQCSTTAITKTGMRYVVYGMVHMGDFTIGGTNAVRNVQIGI